MKNILKIILTTTLLILLIFIDYNFVFSKLVNKKIFEEENESIFNNYKNTPFSISKIITYSSGYGENKNTTFQKSDWILDILQYTDIAIYINNDSDMELTPNNSIKNLFLNNINISETIQGNPTLYYLDSLNFGTPNISKNFKIDNSLDFTVLNDDNKDNLVQYNTPVFFADCSTPITLKYVNEKIKENYILTSNELVLFNGTLLKMANIPLESLKTTISMTINIENYADQCYSYNLSLPISLENSTQNIYDGSIFCENNYNNLKFSIKK